MITAIGTGIDEEFDLDKARYHRIVLMADADVDGAHIRTLLLTYFFRYMRELIEAGYVYLAQPPLYLLKQGKQEHYFYTEHEWDEFRKNANGSKIGDPQRFKGLGEMDAEQLWGRRWTPSTARCCRSRLRTPPPPTGCSRVLMGEDVPSRKEFIERNAKYVENLDV